MFKNLVDFSYKRKGKEAVGFYLAYLLLGILIGGALTAIVGQDNSFYSGLAIGAHIAVIFVFVIGILILSQRKRYKNSLYIILVLVSVLLSQLAGDLGGLILLAYLTTK